MVAAELAARELGRIDLVEALELTALVAFKDPRRHERYAVRWLHRLLKEMEPTLADVTLAVACLSALGGPRHLHAVTALRAIAERPV